MADSLRVANRSGPAVPVVLAARHRVRRLTQPNNHLPRPRRRQGRLPRRRLRLQRPMLRHPSRRHRRRHVPRLRPRRRLLRQPIKLHHPRLRQ
jgi:hypothetical protein